MESNFNKQIELEREFTKDFGSPVFPILAAQYLKRRDFRRAEKVCRVGLEQDPYNTAGKYILAKIHLYQNQVKEGEQLLKTVVEENQVHVNALRILIEIQRALNRSHNTIRKYIHQLLDILPDDQEALAVLEEIESSQFEKDIPKSEAAIQTDPEELKVEKSEKKKSTKDSSPRESSKPNAEFDVNVHMATFTLVNILKAQKHYHQAMTVLIQIADRGDDPERTQKEREELDVLLENAD